MRAVLGVFLLAAGCAVPVAADPAPTGTATVLLAGDVMLGRAVAPIAAGDPDGLFADVRYVVSSADAALANLESPLTTREHTSPNPNALEADPVTAALLAAAGFDAMGIANNHNGDAGPESVTDTITALDAAGLVWVGGGADRTQAAAPLILDNDGLRIAVLAFDATGDGLAAGDGPGIVPWDEAAARTAVATAREEADAVIVGLHGGIEYLQRPDPYLTNLAATLGGWGVDVVWGHGAHVAQPVTVIDPDGDGRSTVVATSLGNFLFDQQVAGTAEGIVLEVVLSADGVAAFRVGDTDHADRRVHFSGWRLPEGDAAALGGEWWTVVAPPVLEEAGELDAGTDFPFGDLVAAATGDATGDGDTEIVASFRRPYQPTPITERFPEAQWADAAGRSAHLGVYRATDLDSVWVAGTLFRPVVDVVVCEGSLAVEYATLDDPATAGTSAWFWKEFGFTSLPDLPGVGTAGCADVDRDGTPDPVITGRP